MVGRKVYIGFKYEVGKFNLSVGLKNNLLKGIERIYNYLRINIFLDYVKC